MVSGTCTGKWHMAWKHADEDANVKDCQQGSVCTANSQRGGPISMIGFDLGPTNPSALQSFSWFKPCRVCVASALRRRRPNVSRIYSWVAAVDENHGQSILLWWSQHENWKLKAVCGLWAFRKLWMWTCTGRVKVAQQEWGYQEVGQVQQVLMLTSNATLASLIITWCRFVASILQLGGQKNMATQRTRGACSPTCCGESPRALKQKVPLGPSVKFLWSSGSWCLVLWNNKVLPWGFTRTPKNSPQINVGFQTHLFKLLCTCHAAEDYQCIRQANVSNMMSANLANKCY